VLHKKEIRFYSTSNLKNQIHISPWFLSGFILKF
jgi:hypothetical protein